MNPARIRAQRQAASAALDTLFPHSYQRKQREFLGNAVDGLIAGGMADANFVERLDPGSLDATWSALSEAMVHAALQPWPKPARTPGRGPDFLVEIEGRRVWLEVVCPTANQVPTAWSQAPVPTRTTPTTVVSFPHGELLARWTSAIDEKAKKLSREKEGKWVGYAHDGTVADGEPYVILVNACRLRSMGMPQLDGISQHPFAVEAAFGVGPLAVRIDLQTQRMSPAVNSIRDTFPKSSRPETAIPTQVFLDPAYAGVSAIWAIDWLGDHSRGAEPSAVVHNPLARSPLPTGVIPCEREYVAQDQGTGAYVLTDLKRS